MLASCLGPTLPDHELLRVVMKNKMINLNKIREEIGRFLPDNAIFLVNANCWWDKPGKLVWTTFQIYIQDSRIGGDSDTIKSDNLASLVVEVKEKYAIPTETITTGEEVCVQEEMFNV